MSENVRYWLWLQQALGEGANIAPVIEEFGSAKGLYDANILEWRMSPNLTARQINKLSQTDINSVDEIIYNCDNNNWQIIDYDDTKYPERLKNIINPPAVLYVDGVLPDVDRLVTIGIVGTRNASDYSIKVTHIMSRGATDAGAVIVSGGALGVDTAAHKGAIMAGGKTIAVLGCGLGTDYLAQNKSLRESIKNNGALVSEFPPFTSASRYTFPIRNRIISGLSLGVLVVEAGVRSGSLITANCALEQGRDLFVIPASVLSLDFAGTNKLIEDGAMIATKPVQLVEQYSERFDTIDLSRVLSVEEYMNDCNDNSANTVKAPVPDFTATSQERQLRAQKDSDTANLSGELRIVYESLADSYNHIDLIIENSGLSISSVMSALTRLEIMGLAESASGKRYKKA